MSGGVAVVASTGVVDSDKRGRGRIRTGGGDQSPSRPVQALHLPDYERDQSPPRPVQVLHQPDYERDQ